MPLSIVQWLYPGLFLLPVGIYLLCVRPKLDKSMWSVSLFGGLMLLSVFAPLAGMSHVIFLIIWVFAVGALLLATAVVWVIGAVKKKQNFLAGPMLTGVTVIVSGVLIGNWLAVIMAIIFFAVLARYKLDLSSD